MRRRGGSETGRGARAALAGMEPASDEIGAAANPFPAPAAEVAGATVLCRRCERYEAESDGKCMPCLQGIPLSQFPRPEDLVEQMRREAVSDALSSLTCDPHVVRALHASRESGPPGVGL